MRLAETSGEVSEDQQDEQDLSQIPHGCGASALQGKPQKSLLPALAWFSGDGP